MAWTKKHLCRCLIVQRSWVHKEYGIDTCDLLRTATMPMVMTRRNAGLNRSATPRLFAVFFLLSLRCSDGSLPFRDLLFLALEDRVMIFWLFESTLQDKATADFRYKK